MTEGRSTGIPKIFHAMDANGSPLPVFDFDENHSFFMVRLPVHPQATMPEGLTGQLGQAPAQVGVHDGVHDGVHELHLTELMKKILGRLTQPASTPELLETLRYPRRTRNYSASMKSLLDNGLIEMTHPHAPRSKRQKYRLTAKGRKGILDW
jgi:ATP-dependent DNA helicase RecG